LWVARDVAPAQEVDAMVSAQCFLHDPKVHEPPYRSGAAERDSTRGPRTKPSVIRVLLAEDDARVGPLVERGLAGEGFAMERVVDGPAALECLLQERHDVCVLDGMLPGMDGLAVLAAVRAARIRTPILMLTARDTVPDRVRGLEAGADDYLAKPFAFVELVARLRALTRRHADAWTDVVRVNSLEIDPVGRLVRREGAVVDLTPKQFDMLLFLARRRGEAVSRMTLLEKVFGYAFDPGTNIIDVHVAHLRQRIDRAGEPSVVQTVRGVGYRVASDVD
jgi:two-component system OmpR family response regulator